MENCSAQILRAKDEKDHMNQLLIEYTPFILRCIAKKAAGDPKALLDVGQLAFSEAVAEYNEEKGNFFGFCSVVIQRRVIDELRRRKDKLDTVYYMEDEEDGASTLAAQNMAAYRADTQKEELIMEIEALKRELSAFDIDFFTLVEDSPKQDKTRKLCRKVLDAIIEDGELLEKVRYTGRIPAGEIMQRTAVRKKALEKYRRYLIACVLIRTGDYPYLNEYLPNGEAGI